MQGARCKRCVAEFTVEDFYKNKSTILYLIKINDFYKIGLTKLSVINRYKYENINYDILFQKKFNDGMIAYNIEQNILVNTIDYNVLKSESPIKGGWSEIRKINPLNLIFEQIKGYNENI